MNSKVYAPTGRMQPYALIGLGVMQIDFRALGSSLAKDEDFVVRLGGGGDIYATEAILLSVGVSYMLPWNDLGAIEYASFGVGTPLRF